MQDNQVIYLQRIDQPSIKIPSLLHLVEPQWQHNPLDRRIVVLSSFLPNIPTMLNLRLFLMTLALLLRSGLAFTQAPFVAKHPSVSWTKLSMALALPPSPRPLLRKGKWYEETCGLAQRKVYHDDFLWQNDDVSRPFYGIQAAPLILPRGSRLRKRDRIRRVAKWAWKGIRRQ
jgi:hypothetical protein